jgi:hypothetical protein
MNAAHSILIAAAALFSGGSYGAVPDPTPGPGSCRPAEGSIAVTVDRIRLTLHGFEMVGEGTSTGALEGPVKIQARRKARSDDATWVTVRMTIDTESGVVELQGDAMATHPTDRSDLTAVEGSLTFQNGTGGFQGMSGLLATKGTADTKRRTLLTDYAGQFCQAPGEGFSPGRTP